MNDIPDWAGKRACELLNAEQTYDYRWPLDLHSPIVRTVAKLVMQHEEPPIDPDEEAVKRIIDAQIAHGFARAVSQYKQEKANG